MIKLAVFILLILSSLTTPPLSAAEVFKRNSVVTGYPARGCQSVTILAPDTMTSDALSTAVFVLGPEEGMKLIKGLTGIEGIIVDSQGKVHYSPGITLN